jgi:hypothetical protein
MSFRASVERSEGRIFSVRKIILVLVTMAITLVVVSSLAVAATRTGDGGNNRLIGTSGADLMRGRGGDDLMRGLAGRDTMYGNNGRDTMYGGSHADKMYGGNGYDRIYGGRGNDFISSIGDDSGDFVECGPGRDTVNEMPGPGKGPRDVYRNCEVFAQ